MTLRFSTGLRNAWAGKNMVLNGFFTTDTDPPPSWTATDSTLTTESGGVSGNCMKVLESGGGTTGYAYQMITTKIGRKYNFECCFKLGDGTNGTIMVGTAAGGSQYYTSGNITDAAWAKYVTQFIATSTTTYISLWANQADKYNLFDAVRLYPVSSIRDIFDGGSIEIYTGTQPTEPDDVIAGTILVTIQKDGSTGITFDDSSGAVIAKAVAESWYGTVVGAGTQTAGWFRLKALGDLGTDNTNDERIDGAVATSGGQLNFTPSTSFANGSVQTVTQFQFTLPIS